MDRQMLEAFLVRAVASALDEPLAVTSDTALLGSGAVLSSILLVGLLLEVEDFCTEHGIPFNWTSDAAMSEKRSHYRTVGSLADYLHGLAGSNG